MINEVKSTPTNQNAFDVEFFKSKTFLKSEFKMMIYTEYVHEYSVRVS